MKHVRRLILGLLLLVLGAGVPMLSAQGGDMNQPVVSNTAHQTAHGVCHHHGGGDMAMMTSSCSLMSNCFQGVVASSGPEVPVNDVVVYATLVPHIVGLSGSPEPFPPKASILA